MAELPWNSTKTKTDTPKAKIELDQAKKEISEKQMMNET